jgi:SAM-dependent methyltransferase
VTQFDSVYYEKYYLNPKTRVCDQTRHSKLVAGTVNLVEWFEVEIESVLDVGAGLGWWGQWIRKNRPGVEVVSTEIDRTICKKYKHMQADITMLRLERTFDLVICQGVLPYLDNVGCAAALENLAHLSGHMLYLEAITQEDALESVDVTRTDLSVYLRKASWYRTRLKKNFVEVGAGLWAKKDARIPFYSLEATGR